MCVTLGADVVRVTASRMMGGDAPEGRGAEGDTEGAGRSRVSGSEGLGQRTGRGLCQRKHMGVSRGAPQLDPSSSRNNNSNCHGSFSSFISKHALITHQPDPRSASASPSPPSAFAPATSTVGASDGARLPLPADVPREALGAAESPPVALTGAADAAGAALAVGDKCKESLAWDG